MFYAKWRICRRAFLQHMDVTGPWYSFWPVYNLINIRYPAKESDLMWKLLARQ